ncbi:proton-coupled folate transporter [Carassius carassius]|uniref:proton-coupled folate transporter n=1 Tax=Carassius carassius TaxID=217509 RepID=UPI0028694B5D|nr:proton-coupled folate transporter [Carassius carassius]
MSTWKEKVRRVVTVEPVIFLYMTSTFILTPAYQQMIITKVCLQLLKNATICSNPEHHKGDEEVQATASYILLLFNVTLSLVSIPPAIMLGSWSDRAGRRWVMALPSVLSLLSGGLLLAVDLLENISVYWTLMAAALTGLTGGHVSIFLSSFSYLADLTMGSSSSRTLRMAVAESMIFVGGSVGFLLGGFLEQEFGLKAAFGAYIGCHVLVVLYIVLWLRDPTMGRNTCIAPYEENTVEQGSHSDKSWLFVLKYAKLSFKAVFKRRSEQERLKLLFLILCTFINNLVAVVWQGFGLLVLFPVLMRCMKDMTLAKLSALFRIASYVILALSNNTWMVFLVAVVGAPSGISQAVIRSLSSAIVGHDEQGAMFSFSASVEATCILIAATIFNGLYPLTLPTFPGMPFIIMAVFTLIVLILLQWISEMPATHPRLVLSD